MPSTRGFLYAWAVLATTGLTRLAAAHPGESQNALAEELAKRDAFMTSQTHLRKRCASHFESRGHEKRAAERRRALVDQMREERGLATDRECILMPFRFHDDTLLGHSSKISLTQIAQFRTTGKGTSLQFSTLITMRRFRVKT